MNLTQAIRKAKQVLRERQAAEVPPEPVKICFHHVEGDVIVPALPGIDQLDFYVRPAQRTITVTRGDATPTTTEVNNE